LSRRPKTTVRRVAVPGTANAQVKVTAVTAKGTYQPTGGSGIDLPGDSAVATQIASLSGVPAAIRIRAREQAAKRARLARRPTFIGRDA